MDQIIKAEWLRRLKSGDYVQGAGYLCKDNLHCCLGVLAEIAVEQSIAEKDQQCIVGFGNIGEYWLITEAIPTNVMLWAEITEKQCKIISNCNDTECDGKYTAVIPLIEAL